MAHEHHFLLLTDTFHNDFAFLKSFSMPDAIQLGQIMNMQLLLNGTLFIKYVKIFFPKQAAIDFF